MNILHLSVYGASIEVRPKRFYNFVCEPFTDRNWYLENPDDPQGEALMQGKANSNWTSQTVYNLLPKILKFIKAREKQIDGNKIYL